jgi:zinc transporter
MNKAMYILSIIAAIFLPLGLLTGLLGINVGGIPGAENKWAFVFVSLFLVAIAAGLISLFKRIKWL